MAFSSGFLSPPSSQALSWTSRTVSILIPPDLYWVHPGSSASCSGPKQNKIWISAWYILKNDPCCVGSLSLVMIWLLQTFFFFAFSSNCGLTDRDLSPQSSHIRAHTEACTRTHACTHTHYCEQPEGLYLQCIQHRRVCEQSWKTSHQHLRDGVSGESKSLNIIKRSMWYKWSEEEDCGSLTAVNTPADLPLLATHTLGLTIVFLTCGMNFTF